MYEMTMPTLDGVRELAQVRAPFCVTIYGPLRQWIAGRRAASEFSSTSASIDRQLRAAGATDEDSARFRQRLGEARDRMHAVDLRVAPSVGIFATADDVAVRSLITTPAPVALVSDRFLVGPLVAGALAAIPPVFVLAVSAHSVRLVDCTALPATLIPVPGLPVSLEQTVQLDLTGDRQTLAHLRTSEDPKTRLAEYSQAIVSVIEPVLRSRHPLLVLAGAEPTIGILAAALHYDRVAAEVIPGNHDDDSALELAAWATPIAARERAGRTRHQLDRFAAMPSRGRVLVELQDVVDACRSGLVDTLLVDVDRRVTVPTQSLSPSTRLDLVDEAVRAALDTDATIVPVDRLDLPTVDPVAAILRAARAVEPSRSAP